MESRRPRPSRPAAGRAVDAARSLAEEGRLRRLAQPALLVLRHNLLRAACNVRKTGARGWGGGEVASKRQKAWPGWASFSWRPRTARSHIPTSDTHPPPSSLPPDAILVPRRFTFCCAAPTQSRTVNDHICAALSVGEIGAGRECNAIVAQSGQRLLVYPASALWAEARRSRRAARRTK